MEDIKRQNDTKEKIRKLSTKVVKASWVLRIICVVGIVIAIVGVIFSSLLIRKSTAETFIKEYGSIAEKVVISDNYTLGIQFGSKDTNFMEAYNNGTLQDKMIDMLGSCASAAIMLILVMVVLYKVSDAFKLIAKSDSPFTLEIAAKLKISFIALAIICFISSVFAGIIATFALLCLYQIFRYGCDLQSESDSTL